MNLQKQKQVKKKSLLESDFPDPDSNKCLLTLVKALYNYKNAKKNRQQNIEWRHCTVYTLWLMRWSRLAHQADLSSEASGFGVLQKSRYCIVVQVIDKIPNASLVCRSQLVCSQRRQRGTQGPSPAKITVVGRTQWQLWLQKTEAKAERNTSTV